MAQTLSSLGVPPILEIPIYFVGFNSLWTWVASLITGNVSQVDRVWTFLPTIYTAYFAVLPLLSWAPKDIQSAGVTPRNVLLLVLQVVWMCRLSYNTWRRGLFNLKDEDYRWIVLRRAVPTWAFQALNLTFIAVIQNILLFFLGLPAYYVLLQGPTPLQPTDYILSGLALLVVFLEFIADGSQWSYHQYKLHDRYDWLGRYYKWTSEDKQRGFVTGGLWAWSRHPNCACEQTFWWIMTVFPLVSAGVIPHFSFEMDPHSIWPIVPGAALSMLFNGSTIFTESISNNKYPAYAFYQQRVGMFLPSTTIAKGVWLALRGKRSEVNRIVYGQGDQKAKATLNGKVNGKTE